MGESFSFPGSPPARRVAAHRIRARNLHRGRGFRATALILQLAQALRIRAFFFVAFAPLALVSPPFVPPAFAAQPLCPWPRAPVFVFATSLFAAFRGAYAPPSNQRRSLILLIPATQGWPKNHAARRCSVPGVCSRTPLHSIRQPPSALPRYCRSIIAARSSTPDARGPREFPRAAKRRRAPAAESVRSRVSRPARYRALDWRPSYTPRG